MVYFYFLFIQVIIQLHGLVALVIKSAIGTAYIVLLFSPSGNQFELNMGTAMLQSCSQQTNGNFLFSKIIFVEFFTLLFYHFTISKS